VQHRLLAAFQRNNIYFIVGLSLATLLIGSMAITIIESEDRLARIHNLGDALWYGIATITTIGYGDVTPSTFAGRIVGVVLMLGGATLFSAFTATVASVLVAQRIKEGRGLEAVKQDGHLVICGWNQYAERVLEAIFNSRGGLDLPIVIVNEMPEEVMAELLARHRGRLLQYVRGDPAAEAVLARANVRVARAAIVLADASHGLGGATDDRTTLVTLALKSVRPDLRVTVEALDLKSEAHLRRAGADDIVISGEFNGFLLSSAAVAPGVAQVVRPMLSLSGSELRRMPVPGQYVGRTFAELAAALRARDGFLVIAVISENPGLTLDQLLADDTSLVDQFIKDQFSEAGREFLRFEGEATRALVNPADDYRIGPNDSVVGIPRR
jgi:voltage-gated potassium channel